jgi:hypothetical protein
MGYEHAQHLIGTLTPFYTTTE